MRSLKEVENLAHRILTTYFCDSDLEFMISTFADDIIWLGGVEKQKAEGLKLNGETATLKTEAGRLSGDFDGHPHACSGRHRGDETDSFYGG